MPTPPTVDDVTAYLGTDSSYTPAEVLEAYKAELAAQRRVVRLPADPLAPAPALPYPDDLGNALKRRVKRNLVMQAVPLGYQQSATEFGATSTRIGADPEIRRLEAPWRRLVVG